MKQDDKLDPRLAALLDEIKPASARNPQAAARARSRFIAKAVSASEERRHNWWTTIFQQKEKFAMNMLCLLYTSPSPRDGLLSRMPSSA